MDTIDSKYSIEVDTVDKQAWEKILDNFSDASVYQTWSYGTIRWGRKNVSHITVKMNGKIVAAAQARIIKLPFITTRICYIPWGPLWQTKHEKSQSNVFHQIIKAMKTEYSQKRNYILRIKPAITENHDEIKSILNQEGFKYNKNAPNYRTLLIDLSYSLDELKKGMRQRWRSYLNKGLKNDFNVYYGIEDEKYQQFLNVYGDMHARKKFVEYVDVNEMYEIQKDLPQSQKMTVMLCEKNDRIFSALVCSMLGDTGIYLLGALSTDAMKTKSSYLLQWKMLELVKQSGYDWYDLGGIDPVNTPGTHQFKAGLAGEKGRDVSFVGQFTFSRNFFGYFLMKTIDTIQHYTRLIKDRLNKLL